MKRLAPSSLTFPQGVGSQILLTQMSPGGSSTGGGSPFQGMDISISEGKSPELPGPAEADWMVASTRNTRPSRGVARRVARRGNHRPAWWVVIASFSGLWPIGIVAQKRTLGGFQQDWSPEVRFCATRLMPPIAMAWLRASQAFTFAGYDSRGLWFSRHQSRIKKCEIGANSRDYKTIEFPHEGPVRASMRKARLAHFLPRHPFVSISLLAQSWSAVVGGRGTPTTP